MAKLSLRIVGLTLLTLAIVVSSCQALFPRRSGTDAPPIDGGVSGTESR
jgi:hypothetical protein